ncbi:hypothetical protein FHX45_000669 [Amycolatopsis granulosa]|nr:hypothetical protein [Amycolatopsis granulosa]
MVVPGAVRDRNRATGDRAFTGSVALLGDTIHNFADALTALPVGIAFALGRRAATRRFTYGLGRAEDLAGVAATAGCADETVGSRRRPAVAGQAARDTRRQRAGGWTDDEDGHPTWLTVRTGM